MAEGSYPERFRRWLADARANPLFRRGAAGAIIVALLDQASKFWIVNGLKLPMRPRRQIEISGIFDLTYVENKGASFGMLAGGMSSRILLSVISIVIAGILVGWLGRIARPLTAVGVSFIVGGAIGNLYDRIAYGYVVDFLDFSGAYFPWVFNIADAAINVGIAVLLLDAWRNRENAPIEAQTTKSDD